MKLELKHLAPYLPYGLKAYHYNELCEITGLYTNVINGNLQVKFSNGEVDVMHHSNFKPIVRPPSDLTKEIEHNGERFIPLIKLAMHYNDVDDWSRVYIQTDGKTFFNVMYNTASPEDYCVFSLHTPLDYEIFYTIQKLLEWHFDIFGLINEGLAIDINTIEI